jgi:hypothetical protein
MYTPCSCFQSFITIKHVDIKIPNLGAKIRLYCCIITYLVNAKRKHYAT